MGSAHGGRAYCSRTVGNPDNLARKLFLMWFCVVLFGVVGVVGVVGLNG